MNTKAVIALVVMSLLGAGVANAAGEYNTAIGLTAAGAQLGLHSVDKDRAGTIAKAEKYWRKIGHSEARSL